MGFGMRLVPMLDSQPSVQSRRDRGSGRHLIVPLSNRALKLTLTLTGRSSKRSRPSISRDSTNPGRPP